MTAQSRRIEAAALVALIDNLGAAGFKVAAVHIEGEGCYVMAPKADGSETLYYACASVHEHR